MDNDSNNPAAPARSGQANGSPRRARRLTKEAQELKDDYESQLRRFGCSCCVSPPCNICSHPGNFIEELAESWEDDPEENNGTERTAL